MFLHHHVPLPLLCSAARERESQHRGSAADVDADSINIFVPIPPEPLGIEALVSIPFHSTRWKTGLRSSSESRVEWIAEQVSF